MSEEPMSAPTDGSQTLERGLAVLMELAKHPGGISTSQVSTECGLHRSIANRLLVSLQRAEFATRDSHGRYRVGPAAHDLARSAQPHLRDVARPVLERLARAANATASLVEGVGGHAVTVLLAEPPSDGPRFSYRLGNKDPLDHGAGGLAVLASGAPQTDEPDRVAMIREQGIVTTYAELNPGAYGIAAPLIGWGILAAVNVITNRQELAEAAAPLVLEAVREIIEARPA